MNPKSNITQWKAITVAWRGVCDYCVCIVEGKRRHMYIWCVCVWVRERKQWNQGLLSPVQFSWVKASCKEPLSIHLCVLTLVSGAAGVVILLFLLTFSFSYRSFSDVIIIAIILVSSSSYLSFTPFFFGFSRSNIRSDIVDLYMYTIQSYIVEGYVFCH